MLVCVGDKFKTCYNLIHKFRYAKQHELGNRSRSRLVKSNIIKLVFIAFR